MFPPFSTQSSQGSFMYQSLRREDNACPEGARAGGTKYGSMQRSLASSRSFFPPLGRLAPRSQLSTCFSRGSSVRQLISKKIGPHQQFPTDARIAKRILCLLLVRPRDPCVRHEHPNARKAHEHLRRRQCPLLKAGNVRPRGLHVRLEPTQARNTHESLCLRLHLHLEALQLSGLLREPRLSPQRISLPREPKGVAARPDYVRSRHSSPHRWNPPSKEM